jgi:hypothetical protein
MKSETVKELIKEYKKLSIMNIIIKDSGSSALLWTTFLSIILGYLVIPVSVVAGNKYYLLGCVAILIISMILHTIMISKCNKYVKKSTATGGRFENIQFSADELKPWKLGYTTLMNEYRYHTIETYVKTEFHVNGVQDVEKMNEIITFLEEEASDQFETKWKPVAILAVILFPVISEYVGFRYNVYLQSQSAILTSMIAEKTPKDGSLSLDRLNEIANLWADVANTGGLGLLGLLFWVLLVGGSLIFLIFKFTEMMLLSSVQTKRKLIKVLRLIRINS